MENTDYQQLALTGPQPRPSVGLGRALKNNFKYIFHFSGRASRSEFWWVYFASVALNILLYVGYFALGLSLMGETDVDGAWRQYQNNEITLEQFEAVETKNGLFVTVMVLLYFGLLFIGFLTTVATLAVSWRRLQDAGIHGAVYLLGFVTFGIVPFILYFFPSSPRGYQYDGLRDIGRP